MKYLFVTITILSLLFVTRHADAQVKDGGDDSEMFAPTSISFSESNMKCVRFNYGYQVGKDLQTRVEMECR